jgi:hypothetical protein
MTSVGSIDRIVDGRAVPSSDDGHSTRNHDGMQSVQMRAALSNCSTLQSYHARITAIDKHMVNQRHSAPAQGHLRGQQEPKIGSRREGV